MLLLEDKIAKIVDHIHTNAQFGGDSENDDYSMVLEPIYDEMQKIDKDIEVLHGISKAVIVAPNCGKVIKIPFNGYYDSSECSWYDEETGKYGYDDDREEWIPFMYAGEEDVTDYCHDELNKYELAKMHGLGDFFAETEFYGTTKDNTAIYLQEKAIVYCDDDLTKRKSSQRAKDVVKDMGWAHKINKFWTEMAVDYFGEAKVEKLFKFLAKEGMDDDLHTGNIGFSTIDGRPIIIDFSGWRD
jgi:hypothetical protein